MLDSKKHTRKQTRERLLCDGKKWRQTDCRQSHQKPSKHGWDSNVILRVKTGGSMMAKHCKVHVLRTGPLSCSWAQIFLIWLSSTDLYVSVDSFLLQTMLKADLYLRGQRCRFSTKIKYWGETVSRQLFNVKMFTGKVYTSEMKTQTRKKR